MWYRKTAPAGNAAATTTCQSIIPDGVSTDEVELNEDEAYDLLRQGPAFHISSVENWWQQAQEDPALEGNLDSWKDVFRVLYGSIKASSRRFQSLSFETLAFGWLALVRRHEHLYDGIEGQPFSDSAEIHRFLQYSRWVNVFKDASDKEALALQLCLQVADIVSYRTDATTMAPAYFVVVEHERRCVSLIVRGTSALKDLCTDLIAHCTQFFDGYAHYGMLRAAQFILNAEMGRLEALFQTLPPGYSFHVVGHSLGGGIAALICYILRNSPALCVRLGPLHVHATTFAAPPVVSYELALECVPYVDNLVNNHDLIARISIITINALTAEMEECRDEVMGSTAVGRLLNQAGALAGSRMLATALFKRYAITRPSATVGNMLASNPRAAAAISSGICRLSPSLAAKFDAYRLAAPAAASDGGAAHSLPSQPPQGTGGHRLVSTHAHAAVPPPTPSAATPSLVMAPRPPLDATATSAAAAGAVLPQAVTARSDPGSHSTICSHSSSSSSGSGSSSSSTSRMSRVGASIRGAVHRAATEAAQRADAARVATSKGAGDEQSSPQGSLTGNPTDCTTAPSPLFAEDPPERSTARVPPSGALSGLTVSSAAAQLGSVALTWMAKSTSMLRDMTAQTDRTEFDSLHVAGPGDPQSTAPGAALLSPGGQHAGGTHLGCKAVNNGADACGSTGQGAGTAANTPGACALLPPALDPSPRRHNYKSKRHGYNADTAMASVLKSQRHRGDVLGAGPEVSGRSVAHADVASADDVPPPVECDNHKLYSPGQLYWLQRHGVGLDAHITLVRGYPAQRFQRIILHRSMLKDHLIKYYTYGLRRVLQNSATAGPAPAELASTGPVDGTAARNRV